MRYITLSVIFFVFLIYINIYGFNISDDIIKIYIIIFIISPMLKERLINLYLIYLLIWFAIGNINYHMFNQIWLNFESDINGVNFIYLIWTMFFVMASILFNKIKKNRYSIDKITGIYIYIDVKICFILTLIYTFFIIYYSDYGGIFVNNHDREFYFNIQLPFGISRLPSAFIILSIIFIHLLSIKIINVYTYLIYIIYAFIALTITGSRWGFFQLIVSSFFFILLSNNLKLILEYWKITTLICLIFIIYQPITAALRDINIDYGAGGFEGIAGFFSAWGGEYRDGSSSLAVFSKSEISDISSHYLISLILPIIPKFILDLFSINAESFLGHTAADLMQIKYGVKTGTIRVGGILESYYWWGYYGVLITAACVSLLLQLISFNFSKKIQNLYILILSSFLITTLIYFPISQIDKLLQPVFSLASIIIFIILSRKIYEFTQK